MKTILVPTDLSATADNAAQYAVHLAEIIKADVKLCNAIKVPADSVFANTVVWPLENYDSLKESIDNDLQSSCNKLTLEENASLGKHTFPRINSVSRPGNVAEVVNEIVTTERIPLVVMGLSGAGALNRFFLGSNSEEVIENADFPLLLIPSDVSFKQIKKIAFATDFNKKDLQSVYSLISFARHFDAEIMIAHITDDAQDDEEHQKVANDFLSDICDKANYSKIYYRRVRSVDVERGLDWICEHSFSDMIAMSHGDHNFIDSFFSGSYTKKLARHVNIPLLVYPKHSRSASMFVF
ncbi:universal stress protein [Mucilaginibacter auburnensis]|uniref:Nucleotide-binding universal stress UspA family protein n=1 Tax=Mucilaginibacter auburnensis TaxID=1457233 RepID=A0A2H9VRT9_9SPHI|nr:universal stress protein [Mucilaginibacter auburnensis]PJJ83534.1 nucleotide-binding universal stress UspA family protein [Mucilaginibacter auburnensis]